MNWTIAALYRFVEINDTPAMQKRVREACEARGICGTLLLAPEGVNGTIAGQGEAIPEIIALLNEWLEVEKGEVKYSYAKNRPFKRLKVRLKKEIITMRQPEANPTKQVGTYVSPEEWNAIISDPDVVTIDTRNDYETAVGTFKGAIDPKTKIFTEFADYVEKNLSPEKNKKVAMYCTGGIRCEKASSYMLSQGFEEVYHLKGGILQYLEDVPQEESLWEGSCFVFDRRVAVDHGLAESPHLICYGCRYPLNPEDTAHEKYEEGVSCHHCRDRLTEEQIHSFRMRQSQLVAEKKAQKEA